MPLATLSIDLVAKLANLEQGFDKAGRLAEKAADRQRVAFEKIGSVVKTLGVAIGAYASVRAFEGLVLGAIDAQDKLNDLAKRTQLTVEQIGGIGFAAEKAGGSVDEAAAALGKLNLTIAKASAGDKEASKVFELIGVSAKDAAGNARDAGAVLADVADKFKTYADGPEKAALGNALFGKSYQGIIPLLQDGGTALQTNIEYFRRYSGVTTETAAAADAFNDSLTNLKLLQGAFGNQLAASLLPLLQTLVDRLVESKEKSGLLATVADNLGGVFKTLAGGVFAYVEGLGAMSTKLDGIVQKAQAFAQLQVKVADFLKNPAGAGADAGLKLRSIFGSIDGQVETDLAAARKRYEDFVRQINAPIANYAGLDHQRGEGAGKRAPKLPVTGATERETEIEKLIQRLTEQTIAELTAGDAAKETEKALLELATNPKLIDATQAQRDAYVALADGLDKLKAASEAGNTELQKFRLSEAKSAEEIEKGLTAALIAQADAFHQLVASTPTEQFKALNKEFSNLQEKFNEGLISPQAFEEAAKILEDRLPAQFRKTTSDLENIAIEAGQRITDALGNGVEDLLSGNFDRIGQDFQRMLLRLAADAIKADIGRLIFGTGTGSTTGAGTGLLSSFLGLFTGSRAGGGSVAPGGTTRVNEKGFETFDVQGKTYLMNGGQWGKVNPAGSGASGSNVTVNIAAGVSRNELASLLPTIIQSVKLQLKQEQRRPGYAGAN